MVAFKQAEEVIIDLVRELPGLILTGSRYFGTANTLSDWDFILPASQEENIPSHFSIKEDHSYHQTVPFWITVYESYGLGTLVHIQVVPDADIPVRLRAMELLRQTGALVGVEKGFHKKIWMAMLLALSEGNNPYVKMVAKYNRQGLASGSILWVKTYYGDDKVPRYYLSTRFPEGSDSPTKGGYPLYMNSDGELVESTPAYYAAATWARSAAERFGYHVGN